MMDIEASLVGIGTKQMDDRNVCVTWSFPRPASSEESKNSDQDFDTRVMIEDSGLSALTQ